MYHFTLPLNHSQGEWLLLCCHLTLPFLHLPHGEWPLICCHFTLPFLHLPHGEWLLMYHFTLPLNHSQGEWLLLCCHLTLLFLHLSHGEWLLICCHFTLPFLHLSHGERPISVPLPHQLTVVITSFICPYVARFVPSVRHVTVLTNEYYSPRTC